MSFLSGSVSFIQFRINGPAPRLFGQDHLDRLKDRMIGRQRLAAADGVEAGWAAGEHILDTDFTLEKNVVNDALCFDMCIRTDAIPADMLRAYYSVEVKALSKNNPSGFPSAKQKREAREIARERLEEEAKDGRFIKRKMIPMMWDRPSNTVLFGATSVSQIDRMCALFSSTFDCDLEIMTSGVIASSIASEIDASRQLEDASPSLIIKGYSTPDVAWIADDTNRDFLGNEFLLWLWYTTAVETDTIDLADMSSATLMMSKTLTLDCPRGMSGHETFSHEGPTRLPEAFRAIQSGKLPRKAGVTLVRHDQQYELTLGAELFSIGSCKLPTSEESETARAKMEFRIEAIRELNGGLYMLYREFLDVRLSEDQWLATLERIQDWLKKS